MDLTPINMILIGVLAVCGLMVIGVLVRYIYRIQSAKSWNKLYDTKVPILEYIKCRLNEKLFGAPLKTWISIFVIIFIIPTILIDFYINDILRISLHIFSLLLAVIAYLYMIYIVKYYNVSICDNGIIWGNIPFKWESFRGYIIENGKIAVYPKSSIEYKLYLDYDEKLENILKNHLKEIK